MRHWGLYPANHRNYDFNYHALLELYVYTTKWIHPDVGIYSHATTTQRSNFHMYKSMHKYLWLQLFSFSNNVNSLIHPAESLTYDNHVQPQLFVHLNHPLADCDVAMLPIALHARYLYGYFVGLSWSMHM